jgi:hypothetical protein
VGGVPITAVARAPAQEPNAGWVFDASSAKKVANVGRSISRCDTRSQG